VKYFLLVATLLAIPLIPTPDLDWTPCRCNDNTLGLTENDWRELNKYLTAVRETCRPKETED